MQNISISSNSISERYKFTAASYERYCFEISNNTCAIKIYNDAFSFKPYDILTLNNKRVYEINLQAGEAVYFVISKINNFSQSVSIPVNIFAKPLNMFIVNGNYTNENTLEIIRGKSVAVSLFYNEQIVELREEFLENSYLTSVVNGMLYIDEYHQLGFFNIKFTIPSITFIDETNYILSDVYITFTLYINIQSNVNSAVTSYNDENGIGINIDKTKIDRIDIKIYNGNNERRESLIAAKNPLTNFSNSYPNVKIEIEYIWYLAKTQAMGNQITSLQVVNGSFGVLINDVLLNHLFLSGQGTSGSPYLISCLRHFQNINKTATNSFYFYKLLNSFGLSGYTPIASFYGTLDGNGQTLHGLTIGSTLSSAAGEYGLFKINYGTIKNLTLSAFDINFSSTTGNAIYIGGFAGKNHGTIESCNAQLPPTPGFPWYYNTYSYIRCYRINSYVGGIAGYNTGNIIVGKSAASIESYGDTGGITGYNSGTVSSCQRYECIYYYFSNQITSVSNNKSIGGIVGLQVGGKTESCTFYGSIRSEINGGSANIFQPRMAQIIGQKTGGSYTYYYLANPTQGSVYTGNLKKVGSHDQALYANNGHIGKG